MIFSIGNVVINTHSANEVDWANEDFDSSSAHHLVTKSCSQVNLQKRENIISDKVRCELDNAVPTVGTRVHYVILSPMDNLVFHRVELEIRSSNASSTCNPSSAVLDPDQRDFSVNGDGLQMTGSSRFNSKTILDELGETCGNNTVEAGDLSVCERNFGRQTHTHQKSVLKAQFISVRKVFYGNLSRNNADRVFQKIVYHLNN